MLSQVVSFSSLPPDLSLGTKLLGGSGHKSALPLLKTTTQNVRTTNLITQMRKLMLTEVKGLTPVPWPWLGQAHCNPVLDGAHSRLWEGRD